MTLHQEDERDIALVERQLSLLEEIEPATSNSTLPALLKPASIDQDSIKEDAAGAQSGRYNNDASFNITSAVKLEEGTINVMQGRWRSSAGQAGDISIAQVSTRSDPFTDQLGEVSLRQTQTRPDEIPNLLAEALFILVCSTGQLLFGVLVGNVAGLQFVLTDLLQIETSQIPWLTGSFLLANGLSVIVSGPLADLITAKYLICGAFAWQALINIIGIFSLTNKYTFFIVRGGQGLSVGILVSSSISVLGRIYQPGLRKTRVFSIMAAMSPFGFWLGTLQGGALSHSPRWIFATSAIISGLCLLAGIYAIPNVKPAIHTLGFRSFDFAGSAAASIGCALLVAGLTQGPAADWQPFAIVMVISGLLLLATFFYIEKKVQRPLLPPALWGVPSFTPMIISYL